MACFTMLTARTVTMIGLLVTILKEKNLHFQIDLKVINTLRWRASHSSDDTASEKFCLYSHIGLVFHFMPSGMERTISHFRKKISVWSTFIFFFCIWGTWKQSFPSQRLAFIMLIILIAIHQNRAHNHKGSLPHWCVPYAPDSA